MFHRGGNYLHRRLTKLYSDTKQSYASNVSPVSTSSTAGEDPEISAVRRDFQIQHDRLLAWGYHWTDTKAAEAQQHGYGDVEIDQRLDQAGFGDVVANIMSEIQKLLEESGRLQHPERYLASRAAKAAGTPQMVKKEWTTHEVATARALLDQLKLRIDTLYGLSEKRRTINQNEKWDRKLSHEDEPATTSRNDDLEEAYQSRKRQRIEEMEKKEEKPLPQDPVYQDPLFIDFDQLDLQQDAAQDSLDPPPYEELNLTMPEKVLGTLKSSSATVIVDFLPSKQAVQYNGASLNLERLHHLADVANRMASVPVLSHNGHPRVLGFTIDKARSKIGLVCELPKSVDPSKRPRHHSLGAIIQTGHSSSEPSSPTLESRFRLAYNIVLTVLGYLAADACHGQLSSGNFVYDVGSGRAQPFRDWLGIRTPFLIPSAQSTVTSPISEPHTAQIFRHAADDPKYDADIAPGHNIYSLGLILLEIGLWMPLSKLWKPKYNRMTFMVKIKSVYVQNLASKCGTRYMRAVERCLDAPYKDLSPFAKSEASSGMQDSVEYLLEIARDFARCCAIDDEAPPASDLDHFAEILSKRAIAKLNLGEEARTGQKLMTPDSMPDDESFTVDADTELATASPAESDTGSVLRKWPELDIPQENLDQWNTVLMPKLSRLLQAALDKSSESCSVSLMMIGSSAEKARTTICIQCRDTAAVHGALRRRFRPKRGWGVVILKGEVRRSGKRRSVKRRQQIPEAPTVPSAGRLREQTYQEKPGCGASIGAFKDGEHLPPVSFGGLIMVDGEPFGMTVHHMLGDESDDEDGQEPRRSAAPRMTDSFRLEPHHEDLVFMQADTEIPEQTDELQLSDEEDGDSDSDASTIRPDYSAFDADGKEFWFLEDAPAGDPGLEEDEGFESEEESESDEDDMASIGDRAGVDPMDDETLHVTQPAIDDVDEDFFPNEEDKDDDHLASHALGYVHASSGIRRVVSGDVKHEVDWALIKIQEDRLHIGNQVHKALKIKRRRCKKGSKAEKGKEHEEMLTGVMPSQKLAGTEVHCCGRSSGFKTGRISQAMALVKLHGRQSFSSSWCVEGGFGIPGDSGAWVYDPKNRQLCGHVLAWGDKSKTAYIAPMELLFEDIRDTLGAVNVCLPGSEELNVRPDGERRIRQDQQLQNSREIELALRDMSLGEGGMRSDGKPELFAVTLGKDISSVQGGEKRSFSPTQGRVEIVL